MTDLKTTWQPDLFSESEAPPEDPDYLRRQLITYIGNKRALLSTIERAICEIARDLGRHELRMFDVFSGSGVVSRMMKAHAAEIVANDFERYAAVSAKCYLTNRSEVAHKGLVGRIARMNEVVDAGFETCGFVERLYAPADDDDIQPDERVFYTRDNARRLDSYRTLIAEEPKEDQIYFLGPLLSAASVHANTAGVFKGFYKDARTKVGKFGGSGADALDRIKGRIRLEPPVLSRFECKAQVHQRDANELISSVGHVDVAYLDPPYNQHPYGSNYFMLNLLCDYVEPLEISKVSGIPVDWQRSAYNVKKSSFAALTGLIERIDATYVVVSFNDEGFVSPAEFREFLGGIGELREIQSQHNTFRGSRNLRNRSIHVTEHLYIVRKEG